MHRLSPDFLDFARVVKKEEKSLNHPTKRTMKLIIQDSYDQVAEWAAKYIRKRINAFKPGPDRYFTLGLPTGSTPLGTYKKLIQYHK